ncbi:hypothetical protein Hdeb2414_s0060g00762251 [Helianthus debilis subsp. tardiflorus]
MPLRYYLMMGAILLAWLSRSTSSLAPRSFDYLSPISSSVYTPTLFNNEHFFS